MIRGTTPTLTFTLSDNTIDLSSARNVYVTIQHGRRVITKTGSDLTIDGNVVTAWLSQEDSLSLPDGASAEAQINWTYYDGTVLNRAATAVKTFAIQKQLLARVVE